MIKIIFTILLVVSASTVFAQKLIILKNDGSVKSTYLRDIDEITFLESGGTPCEGIPTVNYLGKIYNTVQIYEQCWLQRNLDVGKMILTTQEATATDTDIEKYCYNDDPDNCDEYGGLYQWAEAVQYQNGATNTTSPSPAFSGNIQGICPTGWHLPTNAEWQTLEDNIVDSYDLLDLGPGTNSSGFSALLGGARYFNFQFVNLGEYAAFWSSTQSSDEYASQLYLGNNNIGQSDPYKRDAVSIRCLKD